MRTLRQTVAVERPRISIVTPSYQQSGFLEWTIKSVLEQRYPALEYIIVDGGSTDGSANIVRAHASHLWWWCSESDEGQAHAINKGLKRATGEIVGWLNSDDMLLPRCLEHVAFAFEDPQVHAVCGWGVMMTEDGVVRRRWVFPQPTASVLRSQSVLFQPAVFWRRSVIDCIGLLDESLRVCMDQEYFARMAAHGIVPRLIPRFLSAYRVHAATKTIQHAAAGESEDAQIRGNCAPPAAADFWWGVRHRLMRLCLQRATVMCPPFRRGKRIHSP